MSISKFVLLVLIMLLFVKFLFNVIRKKYTFEIDCINLGGIHFIPDKSHDVFIKRVSNYVSSKRTLFCFNERKDNINDVLDVYFDVYNLIRNNLRLLSSRNDSEMREVSIKTLKKLNTFLTSYQNDYRRWYKHIIENDVISTSDDKNEDIIVHETTIYEVQKHYYKYDEIIEGINKINDFMNNEKVRNQLHLDCFIWEDHTNA